MSSRAFRAAVAALFLVCTAGVTVILHNNPFGGNDINWAAAALVALFGNGLLAFVLAPQVAPYVAGPPTVGGKADVPPERLRAATLIVTSTLLVFALLTLGAMALANGTSVIQPTERLERNAELARATIVAHAPAQFKRTLAAADTWSPRAGTFRTCVPKPNNNYLAWCVLVVANGDDLKVVKFGPGPSNGKVYLDSKAAGKAPRL